MCFFSRFLFSQLLLFSRNSFQMDLLILSLLTRVFCYLSLLARDAFSLPFLAPLKLPIRNWTPWQKRKRYDMMKNGLNPLGLKWYKQRAISVWNSFEINPNHCELQRLSHFFKNVNLILAIFLKSFWHGFQSVPKKNAIGGMPTLKPQIEIGGTLNPPPSIPLVSAPGLCWSLFLF